MASDPTPAIVAEGLTKRFGAFTAVDDVSFVVQPGEIVGYLGPNGSGKTTTIRMLCGILRPTSGTAHVLGYDVVRQPDEVKLRLGYMSQRFALYDDLSVRENLLFYAGVYGVPRAEMGQRLERILAMAGLQDRPNTRAGALSGGWRQRLALGCALVHNPPLLFLDEPTSGVDPMARREFWDLIYSLAAAGTTVFVTTHYMDEAEHCGRIGFMRNGRLLAYDTPGALKASRLRGDAWSLDLEPLLEGIERLGALPGIAQARLDGDRAHAMVAAGAWTETGLAAELGKGGVAVRSISTAEPTLEDVFALLAGS